MRHIDIEHIFIVYIIWQYHYRNTRQLSVFSTRMRCKQSSSWNRPYENRHLKRGKKIMPTVFRQASTSCLTTLHQFRWDSHTISTSHAHTHTLSESIWFICVAVCVCSTGVCALKCGEQRILCSFYFVVETQYTSRHLVLFVPVKEGEKNTQAHTFSFDIRIQPKPDTHTQSNHYGNAAIGTWVRVASLSKRQGIHVNARLKRV